MDKKLTNKERVINAIKNMDSDTLGRFVELCRFKHGMNYRETFELIKKWYPTLTLAEYETLLN